MENLSVCVDQFLFSLRLKASNCIEMTRRSQMSITKIKETLDKIVVFSFQTVADSLTRVFQISMYSFKLRKALKMLPTVLEASSCGQVVCNL